MLQVALVALNLNGELTDGASRDDTPIGQPASPLPAQPLSTWGHTAFDGFGVDTVIARDISELTERKRLAVQAESYDEAKALKAEIDALKLLGSKILELEHRFATRFVVYNLDRFPICQVALSLKQLRPWIIAPLLVETDLSL